MQLFVAAWRPGGRRRDVGAADRVSSYYGWSGLKYRAASVGGRCELHLWSTQEDAAASQPSITGTLTVRPYPDYGPTHGSVSEQLEGATNQPPFVRVTRDAERDELTVINDWLGVGRLFMLQDADGVYFSNRPAALLLFADRKALRNERGWRFLVGCGWTMGQTTAYAHVSAVPPGQIIRAGASFRQADAGTQPWSTQPTSLESVAEDLRQLARSVAERHGEPLVVDLTGGRDSRLVAAAFLSAGVDIQVHTHDGDPGEVRAAQELLELLPEPPKHLIENRAVEPVDLSELSPRAVGWHRYSEGTRPASYLWLPPPQDLQPGPLAIGGAGGELAHQFYYPAGAFLDDPSRADRIRSARRIISKRITDKAVASQATRGAVRKRVTNVMTQAAESGITDETMMDCFYARERLHRWSTAGETDRIVSPLLMPSFITAAFAQTPQQRVDNVLHRELVRHLVPAWADVPFFHGGTPPARALPRVAQAADGNSIRARNLDSSDSHELVDIGTTERAWAASEAGESTPAEEQALCRMVWWESFNDHLTALNEHMTNR